MPPKLKASVAPRISMNVTSTLTQQHMSPTHSKATQQQQPNNPTENPTTPSSSAAAAHNRLQSNNNSNQQYSSHLPQQQHSKLHVSNKPTSTAAASAHTAYDIYNFSNINDYDPTVFANLLSHHHQLQQHQNNNNASSSSSNNQQANSFQKTSNKHVSLVKTADDLIKKKRTAFRSAKNTSNIYCDNTELNGSPKFNVVDTEFNYNSQYNNTTGGYLTDGGGGGGHHDNGQPVWTYRNRNNAANVFNDDYNGMLISNNVVSSSNGHGGGAYERSRSGPTTPVASKNTIVVFNQGGQQSPHSKQLSQQQQQQPGPSLFTCGLFSGSKMSKQQAALATMLDKPSPIKDSIMIHAVSNSNNNNNNNTGMMGDCYGPNYTQVALAKANAAHNANNKNGSQASPIINPAYSIVNSHELKSNLFS
jgi:hypothetical protein